MTLYITEQEMIDRFVDGLKKAQSKALEMIKRPLEEQPGIFVEFINGVKTAAGSAHQLAHTQIDHANRWLDLRDVLEKIISVGQTLPSFNKSNNGTWLNISRGLENLILIGKKLATSKAFARADILFDMDQRWKNAPNLVNHV